MSLTLYRFIYLLALPLILLRLIYRSLKQPEYRARLSERFGKVPKHVGACEIWIHAVSVGEVKAAGILIKALKRADSNLSFFVTTTTPTGSAQLMREVGDLVEHMYLPYDLAILYAGIFKRVRPQTLIVMETEVWPTLIRCAKQKRLKLVLANARLSKKSARGYARLGHLFRPLFNQFDAVLAQQKQDAARLRCLGVDKSKLHINGNLKFDQPLMQHTPMLTKQLLSAWGGTKTVIALASSHPKEERLLLDQLKALKNASSIVLMLIPRHPERFDDIIKLAEQMGFITAQRSLISAITTKTQVVVGDSMGEMDALLATCDLVIMGGSLLAKGGHNPIEPAALAKPVLMGPHYHNFQQMGDMLIKAGGMQVVEPADALLEALKIINSNQAQTMGERAQRAVQKNTGAAESMSHIILDLTRHCDQRV